MGALKPNSTPKPPRKPATRRPRDAKPGAAPATAAPSLAATAYDVIRRDILSLMLHPGQKVSEAMLSERYRLGKAPIRAALSRLVQEGLVDNQRRGGHVVAPITLEDIQNLCRLRRLIIPEAAFLASASPTEELRAAYERVISLEFSVADPEVILAFCFANRDFLVALGNASRNGLLASWMTTLEDRFLRILFLGARSMPRAEVYRGDFDKIWTAVAAGRGDEARQATLDGLSGSEKIVTDAVLRMPELQTLNLGDLLGRAQAI